MWVVEAYRLKFSFKLVSIYSIILGTIKYPS